jgi:hypothetical protein
VRTESFHADDLARALRRSKIATMPELKEALGTEVIWAASPCASTS